MSDSDTKDDNHGNGVDETRDISAAILFMLFLLVVNEYILIKLNMLKERFPKMAFIQGSSLTTLLGIFSGILLNLTEIVDIVKIIKQGFSEFFLIVLLPPILYESAINMERKYFFKNFGSILGYAVIGTSIAIFVTSFMVFFVGWIGIATDLSLSASFAFGSLISATDPVAVLTLFKEMNCDQNLFALIFGESILNDAVSIIVYNTTLQLRGDTGDGIIWKALYNFLEVFAGSIIIGLLIGILTAYVLKNKEKPEGDSQDNTELTILFLIPWVSYLIAEVLKLSGIVSIMFCGIAMARYALPNVSENSRKVNKKLYNTLAYTFENLVFIFIGIGLVSFDLAWKEMGASLFILGFLIINLARYFNIEIITYMLNRYRTKNKINKTFRFIMWFSGFRGAMAYALSMKSMEQFTESYYGRIMLTITLLYANINIFIHASILLPIATKLKIQKNFNILEEQNQNQNPQEQVAYQGFWNKVKDICVMFDENCLQKLLLVDEQDIDQSMSHLSPRQSQNGAQFFSNKKLTKNLISQQLIQGKKRSNSYDNQQKSSQDIEMQYKRRNSLKLQISMNNINNNLIEQKKQDENQEYGYDFQSDSQNMKQNLSSDDGKFEFAKERNNKINLQGKSQSLQSIQQNINSTNQSENNSNMYANQQYTQQKKSDEELKDIPQSENQSNHINQNNHNHKKEEQSDSDQQIISDIQNEKKLSKKGSSSDNQDDNQIQLTKEEDQPEDQLNKQQNDDQAYNYSHQIE
ncbi:transporter, monovalent cation:proton antiporter-2 (CPA2) family protein (macronuclear) [Tetrahymena thermophila SB210]|uniref:Sodium/hydrogen exchanger n=1 Tax=Tetrahymena thermophila (strain SB210) TaxID=312017 RepID=I7MHN0_TETTS|nr:transporter, monovalent cation:proton antiporter-2 (CPA2) family protein [Tetrahymena thermophila SB210]EAS03124.2 transporter, monovalent cation:proton antiporter-2 (CPA2) family protein [Tetrahymena thermophila SB210]|eukprot:XP_001023369.2 transporter, monovalent cation:proton antiporter-2 (CPA2) family protein [Tetrahymena thermophila SB210]